MKHFTIENETNNITIHTSGKDADSVPNSERFSSDAALAKLAANWPTARLVEIWNSLPGETPVKKFKDRATATSRIWKAIQNLGQSATGQAKSAPAAETSTPERVEIAAAEQPADAGQPKAPSPGVTEAATAADVAQQGAGVAPAEAPAKKKATREKKAPKTPAASTEPGAPREGSKISQVIAMLKRDGGTTVEEIMTTMQWQKHTTRALLSAGGSLTKKHGLTVISEKVGEKRVYSIKA